MRDKTFLLIYVLMGFFTLLFMLQLTTNKTWNPVTKLSKREAPQKQDEYVIARRTKKKHETLTVDDVYMSVKTTKGNHDTRVRVIMDTWYQKARGSVYFFSDGDADISLQVSICHPITTYISTCAGLYWI